VGCGTADNCVGKSHGLGYLAGWKDSHTNNGPDDKSNRIQLIDPGAPETK